MCTRSGRIYLPLSKSEAGIRLADFDSVSSESLQEVWVKLTGLPKRMKRVD